MYVVLKDYILGKKTDYNKFYNTFLHNIEESNNTKASVEVKREISKAISEIKKGVKNFEDGSIGKVVYDTLQSNKDEFSYDSFVPNRSKQAMRNNEIFDIQWEILRHSDTASKMFNPGSFDSQKKAARIVTILKDSSNKYSYNELKEKSLKELNVLAESKNKRTILNPTTQTYLHKQNMIAGKLIGIFANHNTSHGFLSYLDLSLNESVPMFSIDGRSIKEGSKFDAIDSFDGTLISKNIASFLAASVDAVKDPVLNFLNLNTVTANPAMTLIRLGFDTNTVGLIMAHPIIEELVSAYYKANSSGFTSIDTIIGERLNSVYGKDELDINSIDLNFDSSDIARSYQEYSTEMNTALLVLFKVLHGMSDDVRQATYLTKFNSMSNAVGPTIADNIIMEKKVNDFLNKIEMNDTIFNDNIKLIFEKNPIIKTFYDTTVGKDGAAKLLFKNHFPHYTSDFINTLRLLDSNTKVTLTVDLINSIVNDFMFYKMTAGSTPVLDGSFDSRNRLINSYTDEFTKIKSDINNNKLIDITSVGRDEKINKQVLDIKSTGLSANNQEDIKNAWSSLAKNPETSDIAKDMLKYYIQRTGFNFSPKTATHLASVDVKMELDGYIERLRSINNNDVNYDRSNFLIQFLRNNSHNGRLVPKVYNKKNKGIKYSKSVDGSKLVIIDSEVSENKSIVVKYTKAGVVTSPLININNTLYFNTTTDGNSRVVYREIGKLGLMHNFVEYNANESSFNMKSAVYGKQKVEEDAKIEESTSEDNSISRESDNTPEVPKYKLYTTEKLNIIDSYLKQTDLASELLNEDVLNSSTEEQAYQYIVDNIVKLGKITVDNTIKEELINILKKLC